MKNLLKASLGLLGGTALCAVMVSAGANAANDSTLLPQTDTAESFCGETVETACSDLSDTVANVTGQIVAPDGTVYSWDEIVFLTEDEYPDELMPYIEELQHINEEFGTDFEFAIMDFMVDECINEYCSMTIDEFREHVLSGFAREVTDAMLVHKNEAGQNADTHYYADGEKPVYLTEYPEEFLPYVEELERINAELGTDYTFGIEVSEAEDIIAFYTSMTIDEFRDYIYGAYENDIAHPSPFDEYKMVETSDSEDDILAGRIIMAESGSYWYLHDDSETDSSTGVLYNEESTDEATDPRLGVYRGNAQFYPCD